MHRRSQCCWYGDDHQNVFHCALRTKSRLWENHGIAAGPGRAPAAVVAENHMGVNINNTLGTYKDNMRNPEGGIWQIQSIDTVRDAMLLMTGVPALILFFLDSTISDLRQYIVPVGTCIWATTKEFYKAFVEDKSTQLWQIKEGDRGVGIYPVQTKQEYEAMWDAGFRIALMWIKNRRLEEVERLRAAEAKLRASEEARLKKRRIATAAALRRQQQEEQRRHAA